MRVVAAPGRLEAIVPGERVEIRVAVHADLDQIVGFRYAGVGADPLRGEREVLHAGLAEVHLGIRRPGRSSAELATAAGGAYELGGRRLHPRRRAAALPGPVNRAVERLSVSWRERAVGVVAG